MRSRSEFSHRYLPGIARQVGSHAIDTSVYVSTTGFKLSAGGIKLRDSHDSKISSLWLALYCAGPRSALSQNQMSSPIFGLASL